MPRFRKRPVEIEATQWFRMGDHPEVTDIPNWHQEHGYRNGCGWIKTLEGGHIVTPGDWIIRGVQGEHYACKPDIFDATYEPAE